METLRRPLPSFSAVDEAFGILVSAHDVSHVELRRRLSEHVHRWPTFVAEELTKRFEAYLAAKETRVQIHETWSSFFDYFRLLLEHAVLRNTMKRIETVPLVHVFSENWGGD